MTRTKESDLVAAVLLYASRCLAEGDHQALQELGFGQREVATLRSLSLNDLHCAESLRTHCLDNRLDAGRFRAIIGHLATVREDENLQHELIRADAPLALMRCHFGMSSREFTKLRQTLAVPPSAGRPAEPDEETSAALWRALNGRVRPDPDWPLAPKEYLSVQAQCGAPLRAIWRQARQMASVAG